MHLNAPQIQTVTVFYCHHQEIGKLSYFDILMALILGVNMITKQTKPF